MRQEWGLPADLPLILLSGGVNFTVGRIDELAVAMCRRLRRAVIMVLAGRNEKLLARLAARPEAAGPHARLRAIGFTDRVHELAQVARLAVTKPGGVTVAEALTKGLPMVLMKPVPGQEAFNARKLCHEAAAVQAGSSEEVISLVAELLAAPLALKRLADNARRLSRPATETIVAGILAAVNDWPAHRLDKTRQSL